jgi:hypothetical protein
MKLNESINIKNKGSKPAVAPGTPNKLPGKTLPGINKSNGYF